MGLFSQKSRYWQQKLGSFTPRPAPALAEAFQLFDHLAALSHLVLEHGRDGGPARAHLACVELLRRGYLPRKVWALGAHHAAAMLMVNAGPAQGGIIPLVFDPGLFDGPTPVPTWAAALQLTAKDVQQVALGYAPGSLRGDYLPQCDKTMPDSLAFTNALTDDHARRTLALLRTGAAQAPQRVVLSCGLREAQHTPLWRTQDAAAPFSAPQAAAAAHSLRV